MNCLVRPLAILGFAGVTVIELRVAAVTVSVVFPDMLFNVALITEVPAVKPVARPPAVTVATSVVSDDQATDAVISWEVPSEYMPVAVNWRVRSLGIVGFGGVTLIAVSVAVVQPESQCPHPAIRPATSKTIKYIDKVFFICVTSSGNFSFYIYII